MDFSLGLFGPSFLAHFSWLEILCIPPTLGVCCVFLCVLASYFPLPLAPGDTEVSSTHESMLRTFFPQILIPQSRSWLEMEEFMEVGLTKRQIVACVFLINDVQSFHLASPWKKRSLIRAIREHVEQHQ